MTEQLSEQSSIQYEQSAAEHQRQADAAWSTYRYHADLAHRFEHQAAEAKRHERRVAACDAALRKVG